ncbi:MAG: carbonate dehydratase [Bdellovibrionales bacterium]|nr:carbonate dehydratase [Bdellovibrionales bacterium]
MKTLLEKNKEWVQRVEQEQPGFFERLSQQHAPELLWIGCSDARVPANQIVGLLPGALFVHRNIANMVVHTDLNCLSVVHFAVDTLKVKYLIVCGHYGCGGVRASLEELRPGLVFHWLRHITDVREKHAELLSRAKDHEARVDLLCELNVAEQVRNLCRTSTLEDAWNSGSELTVYGLIYNIRDGLLQDLDLTVTGKGKCEAVYESFLERMRSKV